jgi:hypothetical protein
LSLGVLTQLLKGKLMIPPVNWWYPFWLNEGGNRKNYEKEYFAYLSW